MECRRCKAVGFEQTDDGLCSSCREIVVLELKYGDLTQELIVANDLADQQAVEIKRLQSVIESRHGGEPLSLLDELDETRGKLDKAVRVKMVEFDDGERGCRFIVGEDHVVAEWRGDGIASDTIFIEDTALAYFRTTTPLDRCVRMVLEMCHWEVASAMLAGAGDGKLVTWAERYETGEDSQVAEEVFVRRMYGLGVHLIDKVGGRDHVFSLDEAVVLARSDWSGSQTLDRAKVEQHRSRNPYDWGYINAMQDECENCPFGSAGGEANRANMVAPEYVPEDQAEEYLRGYRTFCDETYGDGWES